MNLNLNLIKILSKEYFKIYINNLAKWSNMFVLTLKDQQDDGAFAVQDKHGDKVLFLFEQEDDAERYAMMLEVEEDQEMSIVEVDDDLAIKTCKLHEYKYAVITPNDIVIPPKSKDD